MTKELYNDTLADFKTDEKQEAVLVVGDDQELVRILLAWKHAAPKVRDYRSAPTDDKWRWLWENTDFSKNELVASSGLDAELFEQKWDVLKGNRIVYPDGTIHAHVTRLLEERARKLFGNVQDEPSHSFETFESAWKAGHEALNEGGHENARAAFEAALSLAGGDAQKADALHFIALSLIAAG